MRHYINIDALATDEEIMQVLKLKRKSLLKSSARTRKQLKVHTSVRRRRILSAQLKFTMLNLEIIQNKIQQFKTQN